MASIVAGVRLALVDGAGRRDQVAAAAHNPVEDARRLPQLFGDLVPLEQYRIALREKPGGAVDERLASARAVR